jgi:hypothetical protein
MMELAMDGVWFMGNELCQIHVVLDIPQLSKHLKCIKKQVDLLG